MNKVCVFCGSMSGRIPAYQVAAAATGASLARRGLGLVYGGGGVGLMGAVAQSTLDAGGLVTGVIPRALLEAEMALPGLLDLHVVETMHQRKARMADLADGFVGLPGGLGTFEELFEVLTWSQLDFHRKPVGLLNVEGYFDPFIGMVDRAIAEGFMPPSHRDLLIVARDPESLLDAMLAYRRPVLERKWTAPPGR
ncbi:MAG: TIGR00730 family Rossman fold protein [bacterium]|nr:TIGR00730 family Rossman fold protein [bacterium]